MPRPNARSKKEWPHGRTVGQSTADIAATMVLQNDVIIQFADA